MADDEPRLFHTGSRRLFPLAREAVRRVRPPERLGCIGRSHFEADECGSLDEWLAVAPAAVPLWAGGRFGPGCPRGAQSPARGRRRAN